VRRHVDPETMAAFREELLPRRKAARVAAHVAHCTQCAALDAQLAGLPALLAGTPAPPMPDALTARIEAALATEAAARSAVTAGAGAAQQGSPGDVAANGAGAGSARPGDAAGRPGGRRTKRAARVPAPGGSRLALRIAAVTAAVVVIAGGGYGVSRLLSSGTPSAGSGASASSPAQGRASRSEPVMGPAANGAAKPGAAIARPATDLVITSGTNYLPGQLKSQVRAVLNRFSTAESGPKASAGHAAAAGADLTSCLARVVGNQRPRLIDRARYNGRPATVIVVPTAKANTLRVLVVGTLCSTTADDLLASTTMPAPR
jgi:hypothetical protein